VSWGSNFVSIKYLLRSLDPLQVTVVRLAFASALFGVIVLWLAHGLPHIERRDWPALLLLGLLGIPVNTLAIAAGTQLIPAAVASLIVTGNPVLTAVVSRLLTGEPLTRRKLAGVAVAFLGFLVVLLYGGPEARFSVDNALGVAITLIGPLAWAFYTVLSKPLLARYPPGQFAGLVTILGSLPVLPLLALDLEIVPAVLHFTLAQWLATLAMSVFALVVSFTFWYRGLRYLTPTQMSVYIYLVPVFGVLGSWLFLGERITLYLVLGGLTILTGVVVTNTGWAGTVDERPGRRRGPRFRSRTVKTRFPADVTSEESHHG
jgi:drug/metabolite transporter (DMT)-like permease